MVVGGFGFPGHVKEQEVAGRSNSERVASLNFSRLSPDYHKAMKINRAHRGKWSRPHHKSKKVDSR
jgi:hypothetical protein